MNKENRKKEHRVTTLKHNCNIIVTFQRLMEELGEYRNLVPKGYIYERIKAETGYCTKKIAYVINHRSEFEE